MTPDDQMMLDLEPDDFHESVTPWLVEKAITCLGLKTYDLLVDFLEPTEDEKQMIRDVLCSQSK